MSKGRRILTAALVAAGALVYGVSPVDVIPEFLFGPLGLGDDVVVLVTAALGIWRILRPSAAPSTPDAAPNTATAASPAPAPSSPTH